VVKIGNILLARQWDGIYRKDGEAENWKSSSNGLPKKLAISNMQVYNKIIVAGGNERKLKTRMSTDK
jgi:hypothetical protein